LDVTEVIGQPLSTLLSDHLICKYCHIVDRDHERSRVGYSCPTCGREGEGGRLYFSLNTHVLIDLMQESYHAQVNSATGRLYEGVGPHDISVVIYFCTLRETLLDKLVTELLIANKIPNGVCQRLLSDNKFHMQKQNKLFRSLTDHKWQDALKELNEGSNLDCLGIDEFVSGTVKARNSFIHEGSKWSIDRELSTSCMKNIWGLISLYVGLHNKHVHPIYQDRL
jgi:hypothetical protein